jgi:hypothetical protein
MQRLGFDKLFDVCSSRERDLVVAMVAERILAPEASKLGMTRTFTDTTLGEDLGVTDATEDELYAAMDWLIERQGAIEKRRDLIAATQVELETVAAMVAAGRRTGRPWGAGAIGVRAGKVLDKYKVAKHFDLAIAEASFAYKVNDEAALDGLYVIRTSVAEADMAAGEAVLNYKRLAEVERAFRTLKGVDLQVCPIRHRLEARVKAHIFLSMLAYYVQWHMIEASMRSMASP